MFVPRVTKKIIEKTLVIRRSVKYGNGIMSKPRREKIKKEVMQNEQSILQRVSGLGNTTIFSAFFFGLYKLLLMTSL